MDTTPGRQPGEYDQRVAIYRDTGSVNADGQRLENDAMVARRWAKVEPAGGGERFANQQQHAETTHKVRMRSDTITRTLSGRDWIRLRDGTRLDVLRAYDVDLRRVEIALECKERP